MTLQPATRSQLPLEQKSSRDSVISTTNGCLPRIHPSRHSIRMCCLKEHNYIVQGPGVSINHPWNRNAGLAGLSPDSGPPLGAASRGASAVRTTAHLCRTRSAQKWRSGVRVWWVPGGSLTASHLRIWSTLRRCFCPISHATNVITHVITSPRISSQTCEASC